MKGNSMILVGKYREHLFTVKRKENGFVYIDTRNGDIAKKYEIPGNPYDGYFTTVLEKEVDIMFDLKYYERLLFKLSENYIQFLTNIDGSEGEGPIHDELRELLAGNGLIVSKETIVMLRDNMAHKKLEWSLVDRNNKSYKIVYPGIFKLVQNKITYHYSYKINRTGTPLEVYNGCYVM